MSDLQVSFGDRVRQFRVDLGWTQGELAKKVDMHQPDLCDLEKGRHAPTLDTVDRVAKALGVSPDKLLKKTLENRQNSS